MTKQGTILVAPLNWGLGHATRCIPIIKELQRHGYEVLLGSDGMALQLLKEEFPQLPTVLLPSYNIRYARTRKGFRWRLLLGSFNIIQAIRKEQTLLNKLIDTHNLKGVISDNRLGLHTHRIPSVIVTHQLTVLSGVTTWLTTRIHRHFIKKFNECWLPDVMGPNNWSGKLGHPENSNLNIKYIGALSRFQKEPCNTRYDILAILSGPEPQRSLLETLLKQELCKFNGEVLLVRGVVSNVNAEASTPNNMTIVNYMTSRALQEAINSAKLVISRSGYTTILDLANLGKKAFFIPTPGQAEQEYLARRLQYLKIAPYCEQEQFDIDKLALATDYSGFTDSPQDVSLGNFFSLFDGE